MGSPVFWIEGDDPEMAAVFERARATFKYFWRELSWEQRRIVPALDLAAVKVAFSDDPDDADGRVEHMWVGDVTFDGFAISGSLLNDPHQLETLSQGDLVVVAPEQLEDWMYAMDRVYGAYTVNVLRARMKPRERKEHDGAWGMDFGNAAEPQVVPSGDPDAEHPMSQNMAPSMAEQIAKQPSLLTFVTRAVNASTTLAPAGAPTG